MDVCTGFKRSVYVNHTEDTTAASLFFIFADFRASDLYIRYTMSYQSTDISTLSSDPQTRKVAGNHDRSTRLGITHTVDPNKEQYSSVAFSCIVTFFECFTRIQKLKSALKAKENSIFGWKLACVAGGEKGRGVESGKTREKWRGSLPPFFSRFLAPHPTSLYTPR